MARMDRIKRGELNFFWQCARPYLLAVELLHVQYHLLQLQEAAVVEKSRDSTTYPCWDSSMSDLHFLIGSLRFSLRGSAWCTCLDMDREGENDRNGSTWLHAHANISNFSLPNNPDPWYIDSSSKLSLRLPSLSIHRRISSSETYSWVDADGLRCCLFWDLNKTHHFSLQSGWCKDSRQKSKM